MSATLSMLCAPQADERARKFMPSQPDFHESFSLARELEFALPTGWQADGLQPVNYLPACSSGFIWFLIDLSLMRKTRRCRMTIDEYGSICQLLFAYHTSLMTEFYICFIHLPLMTSSVIHCQAKFIGIMPILPSIANCVASCSAERTIFRMQIRGTRRQ